MRVAGDELAELQPWADHGWAVLSQPEARVQASQVAPERGAPQERLSRRRSSSGASHSGATGAEISNPPDANFRLNLTPAGWLLLDELAANLTCIRSRSYV